MSKSVNEKIDKTEENRKKAEQMGRVTINSKGIKYQESPFERALKLSSDEAIAYAIRDLIRRDELN